MNIKKSTSVLIVLAYLCTYLIFPPITNAAEFDPNFIISDQELMDYTSMNLSAIQTFLENKNGILKSLLITDIDGGLRTATEIIFKAAYTHKINPKVLLVLLQKEQSLLDDATPSEKQMGWAMGYAVCDDCAMDDPLIQKYKGFATQVDYAAGAMRFYVDKGYGFQPGKLYHIDGYSITPANVATAAFYNYTPHYHGNLNFWKIWHSYFGRQYPDGSLLQARGENGVWLIQDGLKRPIRSKSALISRFDVNKIISVETADLDAFEAGRAIDFAEFSLLQSPSGTQYLLVKDTLRPIASPEVYKKIGFNPDELIAITDDDVASYPLGTPITEDSIYPTGMLLQNKTTGGVYFVQDGIKNPIWSKDLLQHKFPQRPIKATSADELDLLPTGNPVLYDDGELIKSDTSSAVYVLANGKRHPIPSGAIFEAMGYKWENIITTTEKILQLHELAEPITR